MSTAGARGPRGRRSWRAAFAARSASAALACAWLGLVIPRPLAHPQILTSSDSQIPGSSGASGAVTLAALLERAGAYVRDFENRFSNVVTEERYLQEVVPPANPAIVVPSGRAGAMPMAMPSIARRELVSDFLLVKLPATNEWVPFRDVFEVDRQRVRDREDRLTKLFLQPAASSFDQAVRIVEESARYNIGNVQRTINLPVLALMVLQPDLQSHFRFSLGRLDASIGANVYTVEYKETVAPTLVHGAFNRDLFCQGRFWIEAPTGRVMKSEFIVADTLLRATITTRYKIDQASGMAVPVEMKEDYALPNRTHVTGVASYGRFRRFDVKVADEIANPPRTITDPTTGMTLVEIPAGRFTMGSPSSEPGRGDDESQHEVTIDRSFFLGQFEVTQDQWRSVMGTSPSQLTGCGPGCPVERVSYDDVQRFLDALNARASEVRYRLPTEEEWEYACRAGAATPFATGDTITTEQANYNGTRPYASFPRGAFREQPTPAGTFEANAWGVGDLHGNIGEWTADWYAPYPRGSDRDPRGPTSSAQRVVRGGSWLSGADSVRCARREPHAPADRQRTIGFRVAADLTGPQ